MEVFEVQTTEMFGPRRREMSRRSQLEICMDMLKAVKEGSERPTQIMYRANLSWIALQSHFKTLVDGGLLTWAERGNRRRYEITDKGRQVLISYFKIRQEIEHAWGPSEREMGHGAVGALAAPRPS